MNLNTEPNIVDPDAFYERLIDTHNGLEFDASVVLNEQIVAALSEQVADPNVLSQALEHAGDCSDVERDAKVLLLLANHIGDAARLTATLALVRQQFCSVS